MKVNSIDPDQTPQSVASGLNIHCLLTHVWIKIVNKNHRLDGMSRNMISYSTTSVALQKNEV